MSKNKPVTKESLDRIVSDLVNSITTNRRLLLNEVKRTEARCQRIIHEIESGHAVTERDVGNTSRIVELAAIVTRKQWLLERLQACQEFEKFKV